MFFLFKLFVFFLGLVVSINGSFIIFVFKIKKEEDLVIFIMVFGCLFVFLVGYFVVVV